MSTQEATEVNFLEKNLEQIAKYNKPLADTLATHEIANQVYRLNFTKCDDFNLYINEVPVHDEVDAVGQAQEIFKNAYREGHIHIIYGMGLGYLFSRFVKEVKERVIIYEPNLDILRIALGIFDFSEALANPKIKLVTDKFNIKPAIETMSEKGDKMTLYFLPYYGHFYKNEINEFANDLALITSLIEVGFKELANKSKLWALSTSNNLKSLTQNEELEAIRDKFKDKPAIVISAGPSLQKNIETIKKYRDKVVVISVGIALKTLLANGIRPDFTTIIEIGNCSFNLEGIEDLSGINFVFPPEVNNNIYNFKMDRAFNYYTENLFTSDWVMDYTKVDCTKYINRGTVSITATWTAQILGCNPIILMGQDLAYSEGKCYAGNTMFGLSCTVNQETGELEFEAKDFDVTNKAAAKQYGFDNPEELKLVMDSIVTQKKAELTKVKGQNGELLPTSSGYALFVKHFEEIIPLLYGTKLFNCSTGGAQIDGYENALLEDVLKEYAKTKLDIEKTIQKSLIDYEKPADISHKQAFLNQNIAILEKYISLSAKGLSYIKKFNMQLKRTRSMSNDVRNICYKALDVYIDAVQNIYAKNRLIMSLSYKEYLLLEESLADFQKSTEETNVKQVIENLQVFFQQAADYGEITLNILKSTKKALNESSTAKS